MTEPLALEMWRDSVAKLCELLDAGLVEISDYGIVKICELIQDDLGAEDHDLYCELASRCPSGRQALKDIAQ